MSIRIYIRRREQREIAELQDIVVSVLYRVLKPPPVLHGGTVIWRVYKSPRFSEDLDLYHENPTLYRSQLEREVESFELTLRKLRETANAVFMVVGDRREVRVEFTKRDMSSVSVEAEFELVDGGFIVVRTLPPELLLREKVQAYIERRKARDLYDVYYLLSHLDPCSVREELQRLSAHLDEPPRDWGELRVLILKGLPPSFETVRERIVGALK
ncbi:nucleotidyl transferase AbiEii/AbiGii toxin family protein [Infirmifilum sp. NZ]|uniref:nucleotidyl transferase AbiEii/AbiGii toxin family protein n=1 Tax=Infirmifilum sp. NZ TaxID=2926850 RepID=UPI0027A63BCE|nr:nucleotidyl transferase AbiEii/AbiGii toxin family protein [Infirmifilum sp. NZ]UNQ73887.1 nucleotidyl transferase AbiEii/AbiGii toxin family protein [Infirmifilum sp. NZ]